MGCLPFDQKNRLIDRCGKWKASKPEWEFSNGICCAIYSSKRSNPKGLEMVRKSEWNAQLVHLSRNLVFPGNFPFGKTKLVFPFTLQPKFSGFFLEMVNNLGLLNAPNLFGNQLITRILNPSATRPKLSWVRNA